MKFMNRHPKAVQNDVPTGMTRRQFGQLLAGVGALGLLDTPVLARTLLGETRSLGQLANWTAGREGAWNLTKIDGKIPKDLHGTLYRTAPGQKENHGVVMNHLFDGDAYVSGFSFRDGKATFRGRFIETPQRLAELKAGKMLYNEFGTLPPPPAPGEARRGGKNQPSVNIIHHDGKLLGLSEGNHPTAIDPGDFSYKGEWDFYGTLPRGMSFTAHPKFDPATGEGFAYGWQRGQQMVLKVFRMEKNGRLTELYSLPQSKFYILHDCIVSKEHIVFIIPPVTVDLKKLFSGKHPIGESLVYLDKEPMRVLILKRDGKGEPVTVNLPSGFVFHHGNAFEQDGKLMIDTVLTHDSTVLDVVGSFSKDKMPSNTPSKLTRLMIDPVRGAVEKTTEFDENVEFPRFDSRRTGENARYLHVNKQHPTDGSFAFTTIARHDLLRGKSQTIQSGKNRALGEPVFVPHPTKTGEDRGWVMFLGYDGPRNETFVEIRDAGTLDFEARAWTGTHIPLGFHGNFTTDAFVSI